jgi:hypothetical protein
MATTKYIVDNLPQQTIDGNIAINGNITVTGASNGTATYKALLTQTGSITGTSLINDFNYSLIVGETYTIGLYQNGDDFSNIADVQSGGTLNFNYTGTAPGGASGSFNNVTGITNGPGDGAVFDVYWEGETYNSVSVVSSGVDYVVGDTITILGTSVNGTTPENDITITITSLDPTETGCVFIATGQIPSVWDNSSELVSNGGLIVDVLENNLGYDIEWFHEQGEFSGVYIGINANTGPVYNSFNRNTTHINMGVQTFYNGPFTYDIFGGVSLGFLSNKDDVFFISVFDREIFEPVNDALYYQPFELTVKQDSNTTPIETFGLNVSNFPYSNISVRLFAGSNEIQEIYGNSIAVNNINELVTQLNSSSTFNFLGTYSVNVGVENSIKLTMPTNLKNQFSPNNILTFEVFND